MVWQPQKHKKCVKRYVLNTIMYIYLLSIPQIKSMYWYIPTLSVAILEVQANMPLQILKLFTSMDDTDKTK